MFTRVPASLVMWCVLVKFRYKKDKAVFQGMFGGKPVVPAIRPGTGTSDESALEDNF